jgi:N-acetylneuraminic acid mutarotase
MRTVLTGFVLWCGLTLTLVAQVPHLITYQGRVNSGGQPFSGTGRFKFALVGNSGSPVFWRSDGADGAGEPAVAVNLPVSNGLFTVVLGDSAVPGMAVLPPGVFANTAVYVRIWFDDGVNGFAQLSPDQRITAVGYALIADGVRAGAITSTSIANGAIDGSKLAAGAAASNLLASGRSSLVSGGVVLSAQEHATNLLNEGYVKLAQVALVDEKWRFLTNGPPLFQRALKRKGHVALWTGSEMIIWGGQDEDEAFNTGGRYNPSTDTWSVMSTNGAPSPQIGASAVWTGTQLIVWGNSGPTRGGRYNPATDTWTSMSTNGGPGLRSAHTTVWTGTYMILWGGVEGGYLNTGVRYNPSTDAWTPVSASGLAIRGFHSAVWSGTEMIIWGGSESHSCGFLCSFRTNYNDGARYNPTSNTWQPVNVGSAPGARSDHGAVWTGSEMVIWGGRQGSGSPIPFTTNINSGARYSPSLNSWTAMTDIGALSPRVTPNLFWTGSRVLIWGGDDNGTNVNNGSRYNPAGNSWQVMTNAGGPVPRNGYSAVWSGTEMIIWGGQQLNEPGTFDDEYVEIGYRYNPSLDGWNTISPSGEPAARFGHTAVWSGKEMIVWGGDGGEYLLRTGGKLDPTRPLTTAWLAINSTGAPSARVQHTAVWSGSEMLVWGGANGSGAVLNTGGRYNRNTDSWTPITTNGAPLARRGHVAVWTGSEMLVWGGSNGPSYYNTGGRYNPAADTWTSLPVANAPIARAGARAVWTGSEMLVWGGTGIGGTLSTGGAFHPASNSWTSLATLNAPSARANHTAVWTGTDMLVWGGQPLGADSGGRYNRAANTWTPLPTTGVPATRTQHTAVWDGTQMIIWGGHNGTNEIATGGVYDPNAQVWRAVTNSGAPISRVGHTAVWAGAEMIVWGGRYTDTVTFDDTFGYAPSRTMFLYLKP